MDVWEGQQSCFVSLQIARWQEALANTGHPREYVPFNDNFLFQVLILLTVLYLIEQ